MLTWQEFEQSVRDYLASCFNQPFEKQKLDIDFGGSKSHEFDAVSADGTIVAEAKHILGGQKTQLENISGDLAMLHVLKGRKRKLLFISDPVVFWLFYRTHQEVLKEIRREGLVEIVPPMEFLEIGK